MQVAARDSVFKIIVLLFIIFGYFQLFSLDAIPRDLRVISGFVAISLIFLMLIVKVVYDSTERKIPKNFSLPIALFLLALFLSIPVTKAYHNQSFILSIWISRGLFFYFLYYMLHAYDYNRRTLEKFFIFIGLFTILAFYIQTFIYPTRIFDVRMSIDRGTLRLFLPSMSFSIIVYFYYLNQFFKSNKALPIIIALLALSIFILQATRQLIASLVLLTIINLFRSKEVKSRFLISFLILIGMGAVFLIFYDLFIELFTVSKVQTSGQRESVRIKAIEYFTGKFQPSFLTYIFGNGEGHEASQYGLKMVYLQLTKGLYLSDIGIIGDYVRYGVIFVIAAIIMLARLLTIKVPKHYEYLRYFVYLQLFSLFTSKGVFGVPSITLIIIAYLFDLGNYELKKENATKREEVASARSVPGQVNI